MFNHDQFLTDYMTKGFYYFAAPFVLSAIEIDKFRPVTVKHDDGCFHAEGHEYHTAYMRKEIDYLKFTLSWLLLDWKADLQFDFYSESVNDQVQLWHNDAQYAQPDQNATINCFFDRCAAEFGGAFQMAPYDEAYVGTKQDHPEMTTHYPRQYDVVIFNQKRDFMHKATPSTKPRRMISYATTFEAFLNKPIQMTLA